MKSELLPIILLLACFVGQSKFCSVSMTQNTCNVAEGEYCSSKCCWNTVSNLEGTISAHTKCARHQCDWNLPIITFVPCSSDTFGNKCSCCKKISYSLKNHNINKTNQQISANSSVFNQSGFRTKLAEYQFIINIDEMKNITFMDEFKINFIKDKIYEIKREEGGVTQIIFNDHDKIIEIKITNYGGDQIHFMKVEDSLSKFTLTCLVNSNCCASHKSKNETTQLIYSSNCLIKLSQINCSQISMANCTSGCCLIEESTKQNMISSHATCAQTCNRNIPEVAFVGCEKDQAGNNCTCCKRSSYSNGTSVLACQFNSTCCQVQERNNAGLPQSGNRNPSTATCSVKYTQLTNCSVDSTGAICQSNCCILVTRRPNLPSPFSYCSPCNVQLPRTTYISCFSDINGVQCLCCEQKTTYSITINGQSAPYNTQLTCMTSEFCCNGSPEGPAQPNNMIIQGPPPDNGTEPNDYGVSYPTTNYFNRLLIGGLILAFLTIVLVAICIICIFLKKKSVRSQEIKQDQTEKNTLVN